LPSGGIKEFCVVALNAPLLVWKFSLFSPDTHTHTHRHTHTQAHTHTSAHRRLHEQTLVVRDGRKQKPEQKDLNLGNIGTLCQLILDAYAMTHTRTHTRTHTHMYTQRLLLNEPTMTQ